MEERDALTHEVIGAAIEVHREMGPGLLEAVYQKCMECELRLRGLKCQHQFHIPLVYKGESLDSDLIMIITSLANSWWNSKRWKNFFPYTTPNS